MKVDQKVLIYGGAALLGLVVLYFAGKKLAELADFPSTATDADGRPVDAYQGAGPVGYIGAATNAALGGYPATIGQKIGGWAFDLFGPKVDINAPVSPFSGN